MSDLRTKHFEYLDQEWDSFRQSKTGRIRPELVKPMLCPVCRSKNQRELFQKKGLTFVECEKCAHVFINPPLTDSVLIKHFQNSRAWTVWAEHLVNSKQSDFDTQKFKTALKHVVKLRRTKKTGSLLDVGCATGVFLQTAREEGWEVRGVEPSKAAAANARTKFGLEVFEGGFQDFQTEQRFDMITFWASLEYNKDIHAAIQKADRLLKDQGLILILISGNSHSLVMRMLREQCVGFVFNRVHSFNPSSLDYLMKQYNFQPKVRYSILPETRVLMNYLSYRDPYAPGTSELLPKRDVKILEEIINRNGMGYKFISIYKKGKA